MTKIKDEDYVMLQVSNEEYKKIRGLIHNRKVLIQVVPNATKPEIALITDPNHEQLLRLGEYITRCPYCGKDIAIPEYRAVPITLEDIREQTQLQVKAMKEAYKAERKAKP